MMNGQAQQQTQQTMAQQQSIKNTAGMRGKDDDRKLFVGGLPKQATESDILEVFSKYGEIESINVKLDPYTGTSRGFCFIVFKDPEVVEKVLNSGDIQVLSKKVDPRKVTKTTIPGKIFIGGLTTDFNEEKIKNHFGQFGKITEIQWPFDKIKNQRKAFCFITFENRDTCTQLLRTPKMTVEGVELDVRKVKFNPETMWAPGMPYWGPRGSRGPYGPYGPYGGGYGYPTPQYDYTGDYTHDDYYSMDGMDPYYDGYAYDPYGYGSPAAAAAASGYATRPPRGGRNTGGYARHAPY